MEEDMKKMYLVTKDVMVDKGRAFNIMGLFDMKSKAQGCVMRLRENMRRRMRKDYSERFTGCAVEISAEGFFCRLNVEEKPVGMDLSYMDREL